ncbi:MAG: nucleoside kinase, partial [Pseudomonadota bacterium]
IKVSEALHEKKVSQIADMIAKRPFIPRVVLIAGPSSSGKTTFSKRLGVQLLVNGLRPVAISLDNYFVERERTPKDENGDFDFEALEAIDVELFNQQLNQLIRGEEVSIPRFDFRTGGRKGISQKLKLEADHILIIEGIHGLNPTLTKSVEDKYKFRIYISALTQLNLHRHDRISTSDSRLIRRIVRDSYFRGYSASETLSRWPSVRKGENKNIFPLQENGDVMFNSALFYELSVLKGHAERALLKVGKDDPVYIEAQRLLKFLSYFLPIDSSDVPNTSILREFIGGSSFDY